MKHYCPVMIYWLFDHWKLFNCIILSQYQNFTDLIFTRQTFSKCIYVESFQFLLRWQWQMVYYIVLWSQISCLLIIYLQTTFFQNTSMCISDSIKWQTRLIWQTKEVLQTRKRPKNRCNSLKANKSVRTKVITRRRACALLALKEVC